MTINFQIAKGDEFSGAIVYIDGETHTVGNDHPSYKEITDLLLAGSEDKDALFKFIAPAKAAGSILTGLTERIRMAGDTLYFDGDIIDTSIAKQIVRVIKSGGKTKDWSHLAAFLEKLGDNPSKESQDHLYQYIEAHDITILPEGDFILYKGTDKDGKSKSKGYGIVNGKVFTDDFLPNKIGNVVEIPRSMVDTNRGVHCSTGLHAGTYEYAKDFAGAEGKLLTVQINPRDVVSVPNDYNSAKVRVCRYVVLETTKGKIETLSYTPRPKKTKAPINVGDVAKTINKIVDNDADFKARIAAMTDLIATLVKNGENLRRYRNKSLTAKNRLPFDAAAKALGIEF
jgi:hypothetical protein